jgi:hypothetical protein
VPARPFGKGRLEKIKTVGSDGKKMVSGIMEFDAYEF